MDAPLWTRTRQLIAGIRLQPFDTSTADGRARERHRRIALSTVVAALAYGVAIIVGLITAPLTLDYLGTDRYGMWATIGSLIALMRFSDLGIGHGLLTKASEAFGRESHKDAVLLISNAVLVLLAVAAALAVLLAVIYPVVDWAAFFNVSTPEAIAEAGPTVLVMTSLFIVSIPLGIVTRINMAQQEVYIDSLWRAAGSILSLMGILLVMRADAGLPFLVLTVTGIPALMTLLNGVALFSVRYPDLRPKVALFDLSVARELLRIGALFFVLQFIMAISFSIDNFVIARLLGADQVPQYAVPYRLFVFIPTLVGFALTPLWPAYSEAIGRGDQQWIRSTFRRSLMLSFVITLVPTLILVIFGKPIIQLWVGDVIMPTTLLLVGFGLWVVLQSLLRPINMLMNGTAIVRFQIVTASLMGVVNLTLSILLVQVIGVAGVVYGTVLALTFFALIPAVLYLPRIFARISLTGAAKTP